MAVKVWFHKTGFSDNTKEVSFKLNRLFLLQACYEYTESNLSRLENRWKRTSQLKQTKNLHASPGSVLSFHSSRQTAMKQSMEFHDVHSQNLNGWFSFRLTCSKLLFCSFWARILWIYRESRVSHTWNEWRLTLPPRLSLDCQVTLKNNAIITINALKIIMGYPWVSSTRTVLRSKFNRKL